MERKKLLIADDSEMNRAILANILDQDYEIIEAADGLEAIAALQVYHGEISALLLDIIMPEMDGFAVLEEMRAHGWLEEVPVIMISTETGTATIDHAFALGASDYISRPFATRIIRRRIINTILLNAEKHQLMDIVAERFLREKRNSDILAAILGYALEARCGEGGTHMNGAGHLTKLLLLELCKRTDRYALEPDDIELISTAAGLHDIGKVLIPESILKKPGKLTAAEFELVKQHTTLGARLVAEMPAYQNEALVKYIIEICLRHHERWNGEGYPDGLRGDECPIAAQVTALADVYDALTTRRSYKEAYSHEKALAMIHAGECGSFNPLLLECLDALSDTIRREDTAIYHTAQAIRAILRSQDELVRYGGDEFLLLFHSLPQNILRRKLEDICRAVRALRVADLPELRITVSIGGVYAAGQISELVEKADLALYRAKAQKDSAVLYEEDFHDSE